MEQHAGAGPGAVVLPGLISLLLAVAALRTQPGRIGPWLLLGNALAFVVFLGPTSYEDVYASDRISTGVVLASLLCLPALVQLGRRALFGYAIAAAAWLSLLPLITAKALP